MDAKPKFSLETVLRKTFKGILDGIAGAFLKIGLTANAITFIGLFGTIAAAVLIALQMPRWGGLVLLLMAPLDAVDGAMARLSGKSSTFGAFLDSFIDRYDELFVFASLLAMFFVQGQVWGVALSSAAAAGAVMVSYARARAEALGFDAKVGVMTRVERAIVIIIGLLFNIPLISLGIIAILAHITAFQRLFAVWKQAKNAEN